MVKQVLPAVVDVLQLVVDLRLFGLVAGSDELLAQLLQVGLVLTEQVDLFHAVLQKKQSNLRVLFRFYLKANLLGGKLETDVLLFGKLPVGGARL